jgi:glycosyltransferase involved in cell wall biosynthesis
MISVVIPVREGGSPAITLRSLSAQTYRDFEVIISWDHSANANSARNAGERSARGDFLLFSDDDIDWQPDALDVMLEVLDVRPDIAYCWGSYRRGEELVGMQAFDADILRRRNFVPTMALIRRDLFCGFDPSIERLQDWDLWLTMLEQGHSGAYCGRELFRTVVKPGITEDGAMDWTTAARIVAQKHGLA